MRKKMAFTGNKDIDRAILLRLDDSDLCNICKTSKYFKSLCSEEFWKLKTLEKFKYELGDIEKLKKYMEEYKFETWKSYYVSLIYFLEMKWRGEFPMRFQEREDFKCLNNYMDRTTDRFLQDLDDFLEGWCLDRNSLKRIFGFIDEQLDYDLLNPNILFEHVFTDKYDNIDKYSSYILEYMLNSKDKRIHPEYSHNKLLKKFVARNEWNYEKRIFFTKLLKDPRVDPNCLLYENNYILFSHFSNLILSDVRLLPSSIRVALKDTMHKKVDAIQLIPLSKTFLNRGGSLSQLLEIIKEIKYYDKRGYVILRDSIKKYNLELGLNKRRNNLK